ncbi:MAG: hypothetical protein J6L62_08755 [Clostridia bacterium]|nr:hypothetical protein [Clostridia bacterium]
MKKIIAFLIVAVLSLSLFGCGDKDGDLGKQTTVDEKNGYTITQEVKTFKFKEDEDSLEEKENLRKDGFKVTKENTSGAVKTKSDAFDIALQEVTVDFNTMTAYFDRTRGIWKIVFSDVTESTAEDGSISRESVTKETVYVDELGYTLYAYTE